MRKKNDLVDTRSRLTAYPSVVIKKLANIVFPRRITGAVKARTRPVTKPCDLTQQQLPILGVRDIDLTGCSPDDLGTGAVHGSTTQGKRDKSRSVARGIHGGEISPLPGGGTRQP
jgi:hypothetical protein